MATGTSVSNLPLSGDGLPHLSVAPRLEPLTMSSDKAANEALKTVGENFNKACPTNTYGLGDSLKFRIVIPFKDLIGQATEAEKKDLELYNKHQELCSSIDKVKGAFKDYLCAAEAVKQASPQALKKARYLEKDKGIALVKSYQDLIELAKTTGNAEKNLLAFLDDTQDALKTATRSMGNVYYTVHMLRTRISVQGLVEQPELVQDKFLELVTDYNDRIKPQALSELGNHTSEYEKDFAEAFVEGLASVPGLRATDVDLFGHQLKVAQKEGQDNAKMLNRFDSEINLFINGEKDTVSAQYKSLFLESFITPAQKQELREVRDQLKQVKALRDQRDALVEELKETQKRIVPIETAQTAKTEHTVGELLAFVRSSVLEDRKLSVIDGNSALNKLVEIEKQIEEKIKLSNEKIVALKDAIKEKQATLVRLNTEFRVQQGEETHCIDSIQALNAQLDKEKAKHLEAITRLEKDKQEASIALPDYLKKMPEALKKYADLLLELGGQLDAATTRQRAVQEDLEQRGRAIRGLEDQIAIEENIVQESETIDRPGETIGHPDLRTELARSRVQREVLANDTFEITGEALIEMAGSLAILERKGTLGKALAEAKEKAEEAKTLELKQEELEATYRSVEEQIDGTQFPDWVDDQDGSLMINVNFFTREQYERMSQAMADKLETAIEKSRKVHLTVARKRADLLEQVQRKKRKELTGLEDEAVDDALKDVLAVSPERDSEVALVESEDEAEFDSLHAADTAREAVRPALLLEEAVVLPLSVAMPPARAIGATGLSVALLEEPDALTSSPAASASSPGWLSRNFGPARPEAKDYNPKHQPVASSGFFGRMFSRLFARGPAVDLTDVSKAAAPLSKASGEDVEVRPVPPAAPLNDAAPAVMQPLEEDDLGSEQESMDFFHDMHSSLAVRPPANSVTPQLAVVPAAAVAPVVTQNPDGSVTTTNPDGSSETIDTDGFITKISADGKTRTHHVPDKYTF
jgi:hypothetical protein